MTYLTNSKENAVQLVLSNLLPGVKVEAKRPRKDHRVLSPMGDVWIARMMLNLRHNCN